MPCTCCVPGCKSNYTGNGSVQARENVSIFRFPTDPERKQLWLRKIPRKNFVPGKYAKVCAKHFSEQFIVRVDSVKRPDGSVLTVERQYPKLSDDAFPSIFPKCPGYLSCEPPQKRKKPEERRQEVETRDENSFKDWLALDTISSFLDFSEGFRKHVNDKWITSLCEDNVYLYFIPPDDVRWKDNLSPPKLQSAIRVDSNCCADIFIGNGERVPANKLEWLFGKDSTCRLTSWSQFDSLLSHYASIKEDQANDNYNRVQSLTEVLYECCLHSPSDEDEESTCLKKRLVFLVEQIKLCFSRQKRYSCDTLLHALQIYASSSSTYSRLRCNLLTLPSISYLRRLLSVFNIKSGINVQNGHINYLKQKCESLREKERSVILMIDEIHIARNVSYSGGRLEGTASNKEGSIADASTAQVFMISSYFSKNKDVAAIVPVKNINAACLRDMTVHVLNTLHSIGYFVICVISDNNRINRNCFASICGGTLQPFIPHPHDPARKLFFLFDFVHIFKCLRNNWLAQKDAEKSFIIPSLVEPHSNKKASFGHLRQLYNEEKSSVVKQAPSLNAKCLYPTNLERQNVPLMLKVFDVRNSIALTNYENSLHFDASGTCEFINTMSKLWDIINVKHPYKYVRLRKPACYPITSVLDTNFVYLTVVLGLLEAWERSDAKPREGNLSNETMFAFQHTLRAIIQLCYHLLVEQNYEYILIGKFQTDNLEFRFSQYRQLSGANFHVSVRQLLEGEKKLKLISTLQLISASKGTVTFKSLTESLYDSQTVDVIESNGDYVQFLECFPDCENVSINTEQTKAIVYISGYAASKAVKGITCDVCRSELVIAGKHLNVTSDIYNYLHALDRGGLLWPTQCVIDIVTIIFTLFKVIIESKERESAFLKCVNQRQVLSELTIKRFENAGLSWPTCDVCEKSLEMTLKKTCKPTINIFLNNYSKHLSDNTASLNERKLKTFKKRI